MQGAIRIGTAASVHMEKSQYHKMVFIMNALEGGWKVKKRDDAYVFTKHHEGRVEVFSESYLEDFVRDNMTFPLK